MMPRMTGYEVCQQLRETFPANELPVVMLTAKSEIEDLVEGLSVGANDYLVKPVMKQELIAKIQTHLQISRSSIAYGHFVPHEFLRILGRESIIDLQLGDQVQRNMTILVADIRQFTTLSEQMTPRENFNFINEYLRYVGPSIRQYGGFIDKYIGDAVMALFQSGPDDALRAAIAMNNHVAEFSKVRKSTEKAPIEIGVGLHTGPLMLGTVGEEKRMETTVISDAVNQAFRLQDLTKEFGAKILISGHTYNQLNNPEDFSIRFLDKVTVKGKHDVVTIYEVFDCDSEENRAMKSATSELFVASAEAFHRGDLTVARKGFMALSEDHPTQDPAVSYYLRAIQPQGREKIAS